MWKLNVEILFNMGLHFFYEEDVWETNERDYSKVIDDLPHEASMK